MSGASAVLVNADGVDLCTFCVPVCGTAGMCVFSWVADSALASEWLGKQSSQESQVCLAGWKFTIWS